MVHRPWPGYFGFEIIKLSCLQITVQLFLWSIVHGPWTNKRMKKIISNLTFQVLIAIILGVLAGVLFPAFAPSAKVISTTFVSLIQMLIAPIIFLTIVLGIASMGDIKKVGRVGGKALLYFEIVTTFALVIGVVVADLLKPGEGFIHKTLDVSKIADYQKQAAEMNWVDFFTHIIPKNIFDAFAKGDTLQILFFAVLFGYGLTHMGKAGESLIATFDKLSKVFFNIMKVVMKLAPIGAFGGMAFTVGTFGIKT